MSIDEPLRPSPRDGKQGLLVCPFAINKIGEHKTVNKFSFGYPIGAVVHYTGSDGQANDVIKYGASQGHAYWVIDQAGGIHQTHLLDSWGYHAGKSQHAEIGTSLSQHLLGIELICAGKLIQLNDVKFVSWYGKTFLRDDVRLPMSRANIKRGYYHKITEAQENSLLSLLVWLFSLR